MLMASKTGRGGVPSRLRFSYTCASFADQRGCNGFPHQRLVKPSGRAVLTNERGPIDAAEVRRDPDVVLLRKPDEFVVHLLIANAMQEAFDAGPHEEFRIGEIEHVGDCGEPLLVRFVGRCREHLRRQLLLPAIAAVHPNLDEVRLVACEVLHGLARLRYARDRVRHIVSGRISGPRTRIGKPEPDGADQCRVRNDLGAQLVGQFAYVCAGADRGRDAVIGVALQVIDVVLPGKVRLRQLSGDCIEETGMAVRINYRRHHGLAGQIDMCGAGRGRHLPFSTDRCDAAVLDDQSRVFDRGAAVARDEPFPLKNNSAVWARCLTHGRPRTCDNSQNNGDQCVVAAHGTSRIVLPLRCGSVSFSWRKLIIRRSIEPKTHHSPGRT